ncbi:MAG: kelch repeat-containing protein [Candidatus Thermoplasmatota archaeon]
MNKSSSLFLVFALVFPNLFVFLSTVPNANALKSWTQTSDKDFSGGTLDYLKLKGIGMDAKMELASIKVDSWANRNPATKPSARYSHAMATIFNDDKVLLFGGVDANGYCDDTWIYDLSDNEWTNKNPATKPSARYSHAMAAIFNDDKVLLFGGVDANGYCDDTWIYDLSDNEWMKKNPATTPSARIGHAMATIFNDDKVLLFGGCPANCYTIYLNDTWTYDLSDNKWMNKNATTKPYGRCRFAMGGVNNDDKVLLFGGFNYTDKFGDTWVYDLSDNEWTNKNPATKPSGRGYHAMATIFNDDKILLFGGLVSGNCSDETWIYDLSDNEWTEKNPNTKPSVRWKHAIASMYAEGQVVFFGGFDNNNYLYDDTWVYGLGYISSGTFISAEHDTYANVSFKRIYWNAIIPTGTSLRFQIRTGDTKSNLSSKNFVGPDGTVNSYYTISNSTLWQGHNGDRWLQYKAYLSTADSSKTPILDDVTITYNIIPLKPKPLSPPDAQWTNNSKPIFSWLFNDDGTQIAFNVQIDDNQYFKSIDYTSGDVASPISSWAPSNPIHDGIWFWRVKTKDNDGDWSDYNPNVWSVKIDTTPPLITHTISGTLGESEWYVSETKITLSSSDETSGIGETKYKIDGGEWKTYTSAFTVSGEGEHKVSYASRDNAGNLIIDTIPIKIDTEPPLTYHSISRIGENEWLKSDVHVSLLSSDETSGVADTKYQVDGGEWKTYTSAFIVSGEGEHKVSYYSKDNASNLEKQKNVYIKIDTKAPYITITEPMNGTVTNKKEIYINGTTDENAKIRINGLEVGVVDSKFSYKIALIEGDNLIEISAYDKVSNKNSIVINVVLDTVEPLLLIVPLPDFTNQTEIKIKGEVEENAEVFVDGKKIEVMNGKFSKTIKLNEGENNITIYAIDKAGNINKIEKRIILDTIPPSIQLLEPKHNKTKLKEIIIKGKTEPKAKIYINGIEVNVDDKGEFIYTVKLSKGKSIIEIRAIDILGNEKIEKLTIVKEAEGIAPTLFLPILAIIIVVCVGLAVGLYFYRKRVKKYTPYYPAYPFYPPYQPPKP